MYDDKTFQNVVLKEEPALWIIVTALLASSCFLYHVTSYSLTCPDRIIPHIAIYVIWDNCRCERKTWAECQVISNRAGVSSCPACKYVKQDDIKCKIMCFYRKVWGLMSDQSAQCSWGLWNISERSVFGKQLGIIYKSWIYAYTMI